MISITPPFVLRLSKDERRVFQQNLKLQSDVAEKIYDGSVSAFTDYGFNSEVWQSRVLEYEVGRTDKSLIQKTFDFSIVKNLK